MNVEHILEIVLRSHIEVEIVLKGYADQVGHGVLNFLARSSSLSSTAHTPVDSRTATAKIVINTRAGFILIIVSPIGFNGYLANGDERHSPSGAVIPAVSFTDDT